MDITSPSLKKLLSVSIEALVKMIRHAYILQCARKTMAILQREMKKEYDQRLKPAPTYKKGDRVCIRRWDSQSALPTKNEPYWEGPFLIVWQSAPDVYTEDCCKGPVVGLHADFLKRCPSPPSDPVPLQWNVLSLNGICIITLTTMCQKLKVIM